MKLSAVKLSPLTRWRALPLCIAIAAGAAVATVSPVVDAKAAQPGIEQAMESVYPALVRIYVVMEKPQNGRMQRQQGSGSGAIISEDGYVVTNHHVAGNGSHFIVNLSNQEEVVADLVGTDPLADIAVLKIRKSEMKNPSKPLPVAQWGDSSEVQVGDKVFAMGSPGALSQSVTQGIISNTRMIMPKGQNMPDMDGENVGSLVAWFAHDAVIFGGNSGGPLVDVNGHIVGINEIGVANLGGAIPANVARHSAEQIIEHGYVPRSWTGMELQPRLRSGRDTQGVLVSNVWPQSPAAKAGIEPGDLLVKYDGEAADVGIPEQLPGINNKILHTPIGDKVSLTVLRDGKKLRKSLTTIERQPARYRSKEFKSWGITAHDISRMNAIQLGRDTTDGVRVDSTRAGGVFEKAIPALRKGDVITAINGKAVADLAAFEKITGNLQKGSNTDVVLVTVERDKQQLVSVASIDKERESTPAGTVRKGWLPLQTQVLTAELGKALNTDASMGVRVTRNDDPDVLPLEVCDLIVSLDGEPVEANQKGDNGVFTAMLRQYRPGADVELSILRNGKAKTFEVTLQAAPKDKALLPHYENEPLEFVARERGGKAVGEVYADQVETGGLAALGGLRAGDQIQSVNGTDIDSVKTLESLLEKSRKQRDRYLVVFVKRDSNQQYLEIETDWNK